MQRFRTSASLVFAAVVLAACDTSATTGAPDNSASPSVVSEREEFGMPNSRILSRVSDDTVLVELRSLPNIPPNTAQLRAAARQYCGGNATVGLPVSTNRMRMSTIRQYLVRCS